MVSTSETGHAKNVANLEDLISFCTGYNTAYNPSKNAIAITSLNTLHMDAQAAINGVTASKNSFDSVTGARQVAFAPLKALATRVINALEATDAPATVVKDAPSTANCRANAPRPAPQSPLPTTNPKQYPPHTYSNAMITRDKLLYIQPDNLVDTTLVKKYVKSLFGTTSLEYRQVHGLQFKKF